MPDEETPVERFLAPKVEEAREAGPKLSRSSAQRQRSLEGYFEAGNPPRWMERLAEIDRGIDNERRRLERAYRALREQCGPDGELFARRWRETAESWSFGRLNELIRQHNDWYPIERQLPINLKTRDYVLIHGRSYRRPVLGAEWVLEQFPAGR